MKNSFDSPVIQALPRMVGRTRPSLQSSMLPSKTVPRIPSCLQICPAASLPSACRQAILALVPVPHGERSNDAPGQSTRLREEFYVVDEFVVRSSDSLLLKCAADCSCYRNQLRTIRQREFVGILAYEEEPVTSPCDIAYEEAVAGNVDLHCCSMAEAWDVVYRNASIIVQIGGDVSDRRLQLVHAWSDSAQVGECDHYADGSVTAHAEVADVVEEDDGCGCVGSDRLE